MDRRKARPIGVIRLSRRAALRLVGGAGGAALLAACGGGSATSTPATAATSSAGITTAPATTSSSAAATSSGAGAVTTSSAAVTTTSTTTTRSAATSATSGTPTAATSARPAASPAASPTTIVSNGEVVIQDSGAQLPTGAVTVRWVDSGDAKEPFNKKFFAAYHAKHTNITIQYDPLAQTEINKVVPLGIQNGNAPDLFSIPQVIQPPQAVQEGWVAPLDDLIPNFTAWKAAFPPGAFANGITDFNGKTYTAPFTSNQRYSTLTLFNVAYLQQAGVDQAARPLTWDEFRATAKKLTQQGAGKYYGIVIGAAQTPRLAVFVSSLAQMAGAAGNGGNDPSSNINFKTGEFNYTTDQYIAAVELLLALKADGSVFPGSTSLNAAKARAQFPSGIAGMILQGPWNIPGWQTDNPDFKFGVGSQPVPNDGKITPLYYGPGGGNQIWVYAKSQYKAIAGDMIYNMGLPINEAARSAIGGAADPPVMPQAEQSGKNDPLGAKASQLYQEQMRLGPDPAVRNPDVTQVLLELKNLNPDFGQVIQGLFTGQLKDAKAALQDVQDRANKELDRAIKAAQGKGAKVSRDDWKFANWDPTKDYTEADYKALK